MICCMTPSVKPAGDDRRRQRDVGHQHARLQVAVAGDVEVEIVEVDAEVVAPHVGEQHGQASAAGPGRHCPRRTPAPCGRPPRRAGCGIAGPADGCRRAPAVRCRRPTRRWRRSTSACGTAPMIGSSFTCTDSPQRIGRKAISVITESIRLTPRSSIDRGEAHRVLLDTLRGALDLAEPLPVGDVVVVHRRPPAEDVVADEEAG